MTRKNRGRSGDPFPHRRPDSRPARPIPEPERRVRQPVMAATRRFLIDALDAADAELVSVRTGEGTMVMTTEEFADWLLAASELVIPVGESMP